MPETLRETLNILGLKRKTVRAQLDFLPIIREGLPTSSLENLAKVLELTAQDTVERLGVAKRTFARRMLAGHLNPEESERVLRLARVLVQATSTLGDYAKARRWLLKPNRALGGAVPLTLLDTDIGAGAVFDELGRIEHGVFA